jgi:GT2 family glycosyltransferase
MHDIAVIVVNWNACQDLRRCLSHLFSDPKPEVDFAVWVIDNGSSDGSQEMVASEFPDVRLIRNPDNRGFSRANNQGISTAIHEKYRYVYLINSDAFVHGASTLDQIVAFGDAHPEIGIFGTKVLNPDGSLQLSCRRWITFGAAIFRNTFMGNLFPNNKYAKQYLMEDTGHNQPRKVDWVSGCSMVIRADLIDKIGALDERFFMYCEDVDICKRAWIAGSEVWYFSDAIVTHKIGASSDKNAEPMIWEHHRSWAIYDEKYNPGFKPIRRLFVESGLWLRSFIRILNRRRHGARKP